MTDSEVSTPTCRLSRWVIVIVVLQVIALVATSTRYGYHRDELYFIASGAHPSFGYPDQPPLIPLLTWLMNSIASESLLVLRLPSAVAVGLTTLLAALIARDLGAKSRAQIIAACCTASSGFALGVGHYVTTATFDMLSTTAFLWLMIRIALLNRTRDLIFAGLVIGVGFEVKPQIGFVAVVVVLTIAIIGQRSLFRNRQLLVGATLAILISAPYVVWQAIHHWPQLTVASNVGGTSEGGRAGFIPFQFLLVSPVLSPVWIAGLAAPFRRTALRHIRFIPIAYGVLGICYLLGNGKAYYLASVYPALLGLGAIPVADWMTRNKPALKTGIFSFGVLGSVILAAVISLPLLPAAKLQGSVTMAINPDQGETVGWQPYVATMKREWSMIALDQRAHTIIFTQNYGEAGAIDLLGRSVGLPNPYSGHNGFSEWAKPQPFDTQVLLTGFDAKSTVRLPFKNCRTLTMFDNGVGLENQEQGLPISLCQFDGNWQQAWPTLRHLN